MLCNNYCIILVLVLALAWMHSAPCLCCVVWRILYPCIWIYGRHNKIQFNSIQFNSIQWQDTNHYSNHPSTLPFQIIKIPYMYKATHQLTRLDTWNGGATAHSHTLLRTQSKHLQTDSWYWKALYYGKGLFLEIHKYHEIPRYRHYFSVDSCIVKCL
jgi:hypothetical protein